MCVWVCVCAQVHSRTRYSGSAIEIIAGATEQMTLTVDRTPPPGGGGGGVGD